MLKVVFFFFGGGGLVCVCVWGVIVSELVGFAVFKSRLADPGLGDLHSYLRCTS